MRHDDLGSQIRVASIPSKCLAYTRDDVDFLPADALERLICQDNILRELAPHPTSPEVVSSILLRRKKLFAILTLIEQPQMIFRVIDEGIDDDCFPFWHRNGLTYYLDSSQLTDGKPKKTIVKSLGPDGAEWTSFHAKMFQREVQWQVWVPRFSLDCPCDGYQTSQIEPHRAFPFGVKLPFIDVSAVVDNLNPNRLDAKNDSFYQYGPSLSRHQVTKAYIHHAHRNPCRHREQTRTCDVTPFAVKIIEGKGTALHEIETLARFEKPAQYGHRLIRLLSSFEHAKRFYLIFPYADANLQQFWENEYPNVTDLPRGHGLAKWLAAELLGLARGLYLIHHPPPTPDDGTEEVLGRHADIKPENILWFRKERNPELEAVLVNQGEATRAADLPTGLLKICDFGIAEFHSEATVSMVNSHSVGGTHAYCAPEWRSPKPGEKISQAYDSWSLGCVLLHFVTWYVEGYPGIKKFLAA
ncbi:kinase-like domain-containing protein, partial [Lasiosphaeria ovina]